MTAAADRHLLFGLLALQNGLIHVRHWPDIPLKARDRRRQAKA
jgi:hypothetical protein